MFDVRWGEVAARSQDPILFLSRSTVSIPACETRREDLAVGLMAITELRRFGFIVKGSTVAHDAPCQRALWAGAFEPEAACGRRLESSLERAAGSALD
eukprot:8240068-Alexandrium_andersonii.AAC.1